MYSLLHEIVIGIYTSGDFGWQGEGESLEEKATEEEW